MLHTKHMFTILVIVTLFLSACQPIMAKPPTTAQRGITAYSPRFERAECKYSIPESEKVECGYLIVPEDRSDPNGPMIRIYVMNFKARDANPAPDPVIYVPGGPGNSTLIYLWYLNETSVGASLRSKHDTILIEHRGANSSEPAFYCPEMKANLPELVSMSLAEELDWSVAAYHRCHDRLVKAGAKLWLYGPVDVAADIADLRVALGYDQVNIFGSSYGTLPPFYLLRDHPEGIRSVILDSIVPPEVNGTSEMLKITQNQLDSIFKACADDATCNAAYPKLEIMFYDSLARLRSEPITVTVLDESGHSYDVKVDDLKFVNYALGLGLVGGNYANIPFGMVKAFNHDYQPIAEAWLDYLLGRHSETGPGTWATSIGLMNTDNCLQEGTTGSVETATAAYQKVKSVTSIRDWATLSYIKDWLEPCKDWNVTPSQGSGIGEPVTSDIPTLMLVSKFDPWAAPYESDAAIKRFSNGYRFELPNAHVATLSDCGSKMVAQFLADPNQAPDASCIGEMKTNWLLP